MDDLRYPIGKFKSVRRALAEDERRAHIASIRELPARLRAAVAGLSDGQLDTPYRPEGWTVRQVVHHVVDSHTNAYCRFKLVATEDHPTIRTYAEKEWAELPDAKTLPVEVSLAILDAIHTRWVAFLESMPPSFFRRTLNHPEVGELAADVLLEIYGWHGPHHTAHVTSLRERNGW
jgi:uncharacterized damage-inducible protein DinB